MSQKLLAIASKNRDNDKTWSYYMNLCDRHLEMSEYWYFATNNLYYVPGTWKYKF